MERPRFHDIVFFISGALAFLVWPSALLFANDVEMLKHGVVKITTKVGSQQRVGTGVIVGVKGDTAFIGTASHVIEGDPSPQVTFYQDVTRTFAASIQGMEGGDPKGLAALLVKGDLPENIRPIAFNSDIKFSGGEKVTVIGFPRMVPVPWAVTEGTITGEAGLDLIFTGAVEEGNSGGPLLYQGRVVGLVTDIMGSYNYAKPAVIAKYALQNWQLIFNDSGPGESKEPELPTVEIEPTLPPSKPSLPIAKLGKDRAPMVLVPAGEFWMGSDPDDVCEWDSIVRYETCVPERNADYAPRHQVKIDAFYLDAHETTVEQFGKFVSETKYTSTAQSKGVQFAVREVSNLLFGKSWKSATVEEADWRHPMGKSQKVSDSHTKLPVVQVSWFDAHRYCQYAGKRLPTEAEWEYAARAGTSTKHWWGDGAPQEKVGNFPDATFKAFFGEVVAFENFDDGFARFSPVGSFQPNPWDLYDMAGNVWEWTNDWYDPRTYIEKTQRNPSGPATGNKKVKRGGSWFSYKELKVRSSQPPEDSDDRTGFRCAQDAH